MESEEAADAAAGGFPDAPAPSGVAENGHITPETLANEPEAILSSRLEEPAVDDTISSSVDLDGMPDSLTAAGSDTVKAGAFAPEWENPGSEVRGPRALGIRLRKSGQVFFFPDDRQTVRIGSKVIVSQEYGPSLGEVVSIVYDELFAARDEEGSPVVPGKVIGLATAQDIAQHAENCILGAEASAFCKTCIRQRGLDMKLVDVEVLHDRSKIIFFFTAPSRIDFRELVKDLVRNYRTRIELRQIGVRHETQMIGGLGNCGMVCCCHQYLRKFAPVTIKMAKEQNLFLNPAKLSGMCGRLLCCLSFEQSNYEEFNRRCPKLGKKYTTSKGTMKVLRANMFSQNLAVLAESGEETEMSLEEWEALDPHRAEPPGPEHQRAAAQRAESGQKKGPRRERKNALLDPWTEQENEGAAALPRDQEVEESSPRVDNGRHPGQGHKPRRKRRNDSSG